MSLVMRLTGVTYFPLLGETKSETLSIWPKETYLPEQRGPEGIESCVVSSDKLFRRGLGHRVKCVG